MNMNLRAAFMGHTLATAVDVSAISDDDAEMMSIDAQVAFQELEQAHVSLNRLQDTALATEDTVFIASQITEASNVDLALIDNAINQLGAGEGISGDNVMPNMQSYTGTAVNMQSLRDVASSVWQAIKDLISRIRQRITKFFKSRWGDSAKLRKRLKSLIERCEKMTGKSIEENKTEIGREIKYLTFAGKSLSNGKDVQGKIESYNTIAAAMYEKWIKDVTEFGGTLETQMKSWDASASASNGEVTKLNEEAAKVSLVRVQGIGSLFNSVSNDDRAPEGVLRSSIDLAGNVSLFAARAFSASEDTPSGKAKVYTKARVSVEPYITKPKELEEKGEVTTWSVDEIRTMCNELLSVLDVIDRYDDSKYMKDVEKQTDAVSKAGDKLAAARQKEDEINSDVDASAVAMQQYASAYASWTSQGIASFASNFNSFANGVTVIASKCLSNYK